MKCDNIVDCLKLKGTNPIAFSSTKRYDHENAYAALDYSGTSIFNSQDKPGQWWAIDFGQQVAVRSYLISVVRDCNWLGKWSIKLSNDNVTWSDPVSSGDDFPFFARIKMKRTYKTRYLKLEGSSKESCGATNYLAMRYIKFFGDELSHAYNYRKRYIIKLLLISLTMITSHSS